MLKKINWKILIISILIPLLLGTIGGFLSNANNEFNEISKPSFTPPKIVFPIVWTILYILMGISRYLIYMSESKNKKISLKVYTIQLILNILWPILFFKFRLFLFSFLWLLIIIAFVLYMIIKFKTVNIFAAYIQIPYLIWLIFALVLNYEIYIIS